MALQVKRMCPSAAQQETPLAGYKERVRTVLRRLLLEEGLHPGHPLVVGYTALLDKKTASVELTRILGEQTDVSEAKKRDIRISCFKGTDLVYSIPCKPATSIEDT